MGYSYFIILQKFTNGGWEDVDSYDNSGAYYAGHAHYFFTKTKGMYPSSGLYPGYSEYYWYEFDTNEILSDYEKHKLENRQWKSQAVNIIDDSYDIDETMDRMDDLNSLLKLPEYWRELETWVGKIKENASEGQMMRILFGIFP